MIRHGGFSCSGFGIGAEYQLGQGEWQPVLPDAWVCTANIYFETPILPGETAQGDFVLSTLAPGYNTSALRAAGYLLVPLLFLAGRLLCVA